MHICFPSEDVTAVIIRPTVPFRLLRSPLVSRALVCRAEPGAADRVGLTTWLKLLHSLVGGLDPLILVLALLGHVHGGLVRVERVAVGVEEASAANLRHSIHQVILRLAQVLLHLDGTRAGRPTRFLCWFLKVWIRLNIFEHVIIIIPILRAEVHAGGVIRVRAV